MKTLVENSTRQVELEVTAAKARKDIYNQLQTLAEVKSPAATVKKSEEKKQMDDKKLAMLEGL